MFEYICVDQVALCSVKKGCYIICTISILGKIYTRALQLTKSKDDVYKLQADLREAFLFECDPNIRSIEMSFYEAKPIDKDELPPVVLNTAFKSINDIVVDGLACQIATQTKFKSSVLLGTATFRPCTKLQSKLFSVMPINSIRKKSKPLGRVSLWSGLYSLKIGNPPEIDTRNRLMSLRNAPAPLHTDNFTCGSSNISQDTQEPIHEDTLTFFFFPKNSPFSRMITSCTLTQGALLINTYPPTSSKSVGHIPLNRIVEVKPNELEVIYEPNSLIIVTNINNITNPTDNAPHDTCIPSFLLVKENDSDETYSFVASADNSAAYAKWYSVLKNCISCHRTNRL